MIDYKEITPEQIDRMNLSELNQYIASYGKVLLQRTQRILEAAESTERERALTFNNYALSDITKTVGLDNKPKLNENIEYKEFSSLIEARARLKNLVGALRSNSSTITGQKVISVKRRQGVKDRLVAMGIKKKYSANELDILAKVFAELDSDTFASEEIIEGFYKIEDPENYTVEELAEMIKNYLRGDENTNGRV